MISIFSHLPMGGETLIRPWDWLQSPEITKQMDIEQISVNLSWERINRVKDGNLCVRVGVWGRGGGESGGQLVLLSSLLVLLLSCVCAMMADKVCFLHKSYYSNFHRTLTSRAGENVLRFLSKLSLSLIVHFSSVLLANLLFLFSLWAWSLPKNIQWLREI